MSAGFSYFADDTAYIAAVTSALNDLPESKNLYLTVEVKEQESQAKVGDWSDEIAADAWYYTETWGRETAADSESVSLAEVAAFLDFEGVVENCTEDWLRTNMSAYRGVSSKFTNTEAVPDAG